MTNLENLTKKELREALWNYNNIRNSYKNCPQSKIMEKNYLGCKATNAEFGTYHIKSGNVTAVLSYDLSDDTNPTFMHSFKIDGLEELVMTDDIEEHLNDLKGEFQKSFLENLDLAPVSLYIEELTGTYPHFTKSIKQNKDGGYRLDICSQDIKEHCGIFSNILESATIDTFGSIHFYISNEGNQELDIPSVHISYKHKDGGSNGMHIASNIEYDLANNRWMLRYRNEEGKREFCEIFERNGKLNRI